MKTVALFIVTFASMLGFQAFANPLLSVSPGSLYFSATSTTAPPQIQFMNISNFGDAPLEDLNVYNGCFSQLNVFGVCPQTLDAGQSCMLEVQFNPIFAGPVFCQIQVSAGIAGTQYVYVNGQVGN